MSHEDLPRTRASSFQKETVANALRFALDDGQLDFQEYDTRVRTARASTYRDELPPLLVDLDLGPNLPATTTTGYVEAIGQRFAQVIMPEQMDAIHHHDAVPATRGSNSLESPGHSWVVGATGRKPKTRSVVILSDGGHHSGVALPRRHEVVTIMGECTLDLTTAAFESPTTTIAVRVVLGEVRIIVPDSFNLVHSLTPILGSVNTKSTKGAGPTNQADPSVPTIHLTGVCVLGEVSIIRVGQQ